MSVSTTKIIDSLLGGDVVLLPTDTVYGLAASPKFPDAVEGIYQLKERPRHMQLPVMVANLQDLEELGVEITHSARKLLESAFVPGALSIIFGFSYHGPRLPWLAGREEVAVRIPKHAQLLEVLAATGPLLVTSANRHRSPKTPSSVAEILSELNGMPGLVVDGGLVEDIASTIINCRLNPPVVERLGRISKEELFKLMGNG